MILFSDTADVKLTFTSDGKYKFLILFKYTIQLF